MKLIKKSIFAVLILAVMSILVTKATSVTNVIQLLDQNIEALAVEDPLHPSSPPDINGSTGGSGYWDYYEGAIIICDTHQHAFSAQCWRFSFESDWTGRNCTFYCYFSGVQADHCSTAWAVLSSFFAYCAEY